ncbi:NAD(P)H-dependent flavin oxidoreductase [Xanthovirga aplysinae]|uniref:NAD(P)H-dependent flavin oxidoreductase n=1 Tax=Xanthovirga aplysinae TaxID=2529853 RepID=UPI0012BCCA1F|nr:nitronate monooxygenase [Xanthovirga aplysinae]MTI31864.1 nitronate monooxygenase [Xanthovirga aplysinae]
MDSINTELTKMLGIRYPIIMAPMFLVSNTKMIIEGIKSGITGAIPALNYRTGKELRDAILEIKAECDGPFGINLIVNKSNLKLNDQLEACVSLGVDFIITSLGSPEKVIQACKPKGIKVFCDVVDLEYAKKVEALGADALIAVNKEAGGHAGPTPASQLIPTLKKECGIPVISAGGVGRGEHLKEKLALGACGISMGSPFIASSEAGVSKEYKEAVVNYGAKDIVMSTKLSGTPCSVINTPYVQKIGHKQNALESFLGKNKKFKKFVKMLTFYKGMKSLEKAAFSATYKTVWCAGPSIEYVNEIKPISGIVSSLINQYKSA